VKRSEILRRLEERLARGEISEKTYVEIKGRYEAEPDEPEPQESSQVGHAGHAGHPEDLGMLIERTIRESVEPMLRGMPDLERRIRESVDPAISGMRFGDFGEGVQSRNGNVKIVGSGVVSGNPVRAHEFKSAGSGRVAGGPSPGPHRHGAAPSRSRAGPAGNRRCGRRSNRTEADQ